MLSRLKGQKAEHYAEQYLKKQKLRLIERNFHSKYGEIDLIMRNDNTLVFVEVRYRASTRHGSGAETVDYRKQQKIIKTAQFFLQQMKKYQHLNCRFDVVSVTLGHKSLSAEWFRNAFQLSGW